MDTGLLIGRIILVSIFVFSGTVKLLDVSGTASHIAAKGLPAPEILAIATGVFEVVCGTMVAVGWKTKHAAIALAIFTIVAAYFFHDFWNVAPGSERIAQMLNAFKNFSMMGGLLFVGFAGAGRLSIDAHAGAAVRLYEGYEDKRT